MRSLARITLLFTLTLIALPLQSADRTIQIVGGTVVPDARYPWMASIFFRAQGNNFRPGCGGSLIADRWILSAAHCFVNSETGTLIDPNNVAFFLGSTDLTSDDSIFDTVSSIIVHPGYNPFTLQNDIALLELPDSVAIDPITIPNLTNPFPQSGERATVTGWGSTSEGGEQSLLLREVELPIVTHNACLPFYGDTLTEPTMVCAGGSRAGGKDSCQGDSGGPLFVPRGDQFVQAGVVSSGLGCARPGIPGIYTRVAAYFDWITSIVNAPQVYNGADEDSVIAVADPVEVLAANGRITDSVLLGGTIIYQAPGINQITLETLRGDADLYVFSSPSFTNDSLLCSSFETTSIDECLLDSVSTYYVAIIGFEDSDYTLTTSNGSGEIVDVDIETLQIDQPVAGSLLKDTAVVFRATTGNIATLTSIAGDADLLVSSSENFSIDTLICLSEEGNSALDSCAYDNSLPEVYIGVYGFTDASYSLTISSVEPVVTVQSGTPDIDSSESGGGGTLSPLFALLALLTRLKYQRRTAA